MRKPLLAVAAIAVSALPAYSADVRGVTDKEIVIGTYSDLSGVAVEFGLNNTNAMRLMFEEKNTKGGINGRIIKYIVEDSQYQVPRAVQAINKLVNLDNVFLTIGNVGTPMNNATIPIQLEKNVPNIFPLSSARSMFTPIHKLKFALTSTYYDQIRGGLKNFVETRGKKNICAASQDTDFGRDIMDGVRDQLKALDGKATLVGETLHKPTDTDFSAAVSKLRDSNCDLIVLGMIVRDTIQFTSAVRKTGWNVDLLGQQGIVDSAVSGVSGGGTDGIYAMTGSIFTADDTTNPDIVSFANRFKDKYGREPNPGAQTGYTMAELTTMALEKAGKDLTVDSFVAALESIKNYRDIFGNAPINFGPDKHQGSNQSFLMQVKGGKWVPISTEPFGY
jgi:branched-chain amino acid transport system substrate-binding protein